jgi:hypothetical protein
MAKKQQKIAQLHKNLFAKVTKSAKFKNKTKYFV